MVCRLRVHMILVIMTFRIIGRIPRYYPCFASGLASTYFPMLVVPSVLTHFASLFGMVRGGTTFYRHLLLSVFISNERSSSNSGRVRSTCISFLSSIFGSLEAFLALEIAHFLRSVICLSMVLESGTVLFIASIKCVICNFGAIWDS